MRKTRIGIFILFMMLLPGIAYADSISLSCPSTATPGSTITCTVSANVTKAIYAYETAISLPTDFSILNDRINFTTSADWQEGTNISSNGKIEAYIANGDGPGNITLGTLQIVVGNGATMGENTIGLSNTEFTYLENDQEVNAGGASASVTVSQGGVTPNTGTGLKSLSATVGVLAPMFSQEHYSYILTLPAGTESFGFVAEANDSNATITYTNFDTGEALTPGSISFITADKTSMLIRIKVGNESKEYSVTVNRESSSNVGKGELSSLTVGGKTVNLVSGKYDYTITLDDVTSYQVVATLDDSTNFKFDDYLVPPFTGSGEQEYGLTIVPKVSGENSITYKITVKKAGGSGNASSSAPAPSSSQVQPTPSNPTTGSSFVLFTIAIMLAAFGVSYYLYKQNLNQNN